MNRLLTLAVLFCWVSMAGADTVSLKSGAQQKGIVVEKYNDRVVLSTVDGEVEVKDSDIKDIIYDRREDNLVKLGDFHYNKGNMLKAYAYYRKAYQLNPEHKEAQEKFIHIKDLLLRKPDKKLEDDIERRQALFRESGKVYSPEIPDLPAPTLEDMFRDATGMVLGSVGEMPQVESVMPQSPADNAGVRSGDIIISVWGRLTGYSDIPELMRSIVESITPEIKVSIKRQINMQIAKEDTGYAGIGGLGLSLTMQEQGLTIGQVAPDSTADRYGLIGTDIITSIGGESTRYMPLKDAIRLISDSSSNGRLQLEIIRDTSIWKKEL